MNTMEFCVCYMHSLNNYFQNKYLVPGEMCLASASLLWAPTSNMDCHCASLLLKSYWTLELIDVMTKIIIINNSERREFLMTQWSNTDFFGRSKMKISLERYKDILTNKKKTYYASPPFFGKKANLAPALVSNKMQLREDGKFAYMLPH